jgi:PilZ domain
MVETRIAPRYPVHKPGVANYGGDKYPCTVRDLSTTGAAIEFSEPVSAIPIKKAFTLVMPDDRLELACRIVWQRDYRMGVTFE